MQWLMTVVAVLDASTVNHPFRSYTIHSQTADAKPVARAVIGRLIRHFGLFLTLSESQMCLRVLI